MAVRNATPQPATTQRPAISGLWLLAGLLVLRFSLILVPAGYRDQPGPVWVMPTMTYGTYLLTALLIYVERRRLTLFHIDRLALTLFLIMPVLVAPLLLVARRQFLPLPIALAVLVAAVMAWLFLALRREGALPQARRDIWRWVGLAVLLGVASGTIFGYGSWWQSGAQGTLRWSGLIQVGINVLMQVGNAASLEEPLFRGFLWGYLRLAGWREGWIWLFQAALFAVGHLYYIILHPLNFWVLVPMSALAFGWVAWRSRSIGASMLTHGLNNALADFIAHYRF